MNTTDAIKKDVIKAFQFRHATKEFNTTKLVSDDDINFILQTANLSPSSFGFEPWHFIVVQDKELRELLKPAAWGATLKLDTASHFILALSMKAPMVKAGSDYTSHMVRGVKQFPEDSAQTYLKFYKAFQENDFKLDTDDKLFDWSSKQSYIALANMMTAAALIGIDSCPMEGFDRAKVETILHKHFGVDTTKYGMSYMLAFGYRKQEPEFPKSRRPMDDIITWKK